MQGKKVGSSGRDDQSGPATFITVIAWLFIILAGFATCVFLLQSVMIDSMLRPPDTQAAISDAGGGDLPAFPAFVIRHMRFGMLAFLALCASTLLAAIGLLKRNNWARIVFIGLMGLGIVWNVGGVVIQYGVISALFRVHANEFNSVHSQWETITTIMAIFSSVIALGFACLFGWVIKRLVSPGIRGEFRRTIGLRA
jgi:hypothetical protein